MTVSIMFGKQVDSIDDLAVVGELAAERNRRLWLGQSFHIESHDALAALTGRGLDLSVGLSVAVAPLRTPLDAALRARSVAALTSRRPTLAYGIGTMSAAASLLGRELQTPGRWIRDYVASVRTLLDGGVPAGSSMALPPLDTPPVDVGCGVLRPTMARLAGEVADFAVTWLVPHDHVRDTLMPAMVQGAASAGRDRPRMVSVLQCAVARPGRVAPALAAIACGAHLQQPHYRAMLTGAGLKLDGHPAHDLRAVARAGLFAWGSPADIAAVVRQMLDDGVDEVVLTTGAVGIAHGVAAMAEDLSDILAAVDSGESSRRVA